MKFEVLVSNVGTVLRTDKENHARAIFNQYVSWSKKSSGRIAGEDVALFCDGEPIKEYEGPQSRYN